MIKPTVGRVMWYWPEAEDRGEQPFCALVAHVCDDNMVNLAVFSEEGDVLGGMRRVPIVQEGGPHTIGASPYCEWMPYQRGQAAKADELQKQLKTAS